MAWKVPINIQITHIKLWKVVQVYKTSDQKLDVWSKIVILQ